MKKWAYYNDNDPFVCEWAKELIKRGLVMDGEVDNRDIREIEPRELEGFVQCHFFCGILGWSYALRLAQWPEDREVWTGSCPCQPFSVAGKGKGLDDARHLWPAFRWLIAQCRPSTVLGEQVASKDGRTWLTGVRADLEALGYRVGAADLCAAGIGTPHIRQRLYWVADTESVRGGKGQSNRKGYIERNSERESFMPVDNCNDGRLGHASNWEDHGREIGIMAGETQQRGRCDDAPDITGANGGLADTADQRTGRSGQTEQGRNGKNNGIPGKDGRESLWFQSIYWPCRDGKYRRVPARWLEDAGKWEIEPALFPLADGLPNRVGILRGAGNSIVPEVAAEFIKSFKEAHI